MDGRIGFDQSPRKFHELDSHATRFNPANLVSVCVLWGSPSQQLRPFHVQRELAPIQPSLSSEYPPEEVESDVEAGKGDKTTLFLLEPTTWALAPWIRSPLSSFIIGHLFFGGDIHDRIDRIQGCTARSCCQHPPACPSASPWLRG